MPDLTDPQPPQAPESITDSMPGSIPDPLPVSTPGSSPEATPHAADDPLPMRSAAEDAPARAAQFHRPMPDQAPAEPASRWPMLMGILAIALLAGGLAWLWTRVSDLTHIVETTAAQAPTPAPPADPAGLAALEDQVRSLGDRLRVVETKPPPPAPEAPKPVDLGPLEARMAALEQRPEPKPVDLGPVAARIAALEQRPEPKPVDLGSVEARIAALEQRPEPKPVDLGPVEARMAAVEQRPAPPPPLEDAALRSRLDDLSRRLDEAGRKLDAAQAQAADLAGQSAKAAADISARAARDETMQATALALAAGRPLGPQTTPALQKFADAAPPTEAALRLSFDNAAKAAAAASDPAAGSASFGSRMLARMQSLVTVRQGDHVLVGAPASVALAHARTALEAGDLAGAVAALDALDPPAARAMAPWRAQAQSLLDARAALAGTTR